jgi:L-ascorbate metabolism protein UlaG (beta-lactamase superfamily)
MEALKNAIKTVNLTDNQTALFYLGQEGFIFKNKNATFGIDLYLSDFVDKNCCQFVKWERLYPAPITAEKLDMLDFVLCTHAHYDHADPETLPKLAKANAKTVFIVPAPTVETISSYGIPTERIIPAKAFCPITVNGVTITPIPSAHEVFHQDENGNYFELGYIVNNGSTTIFHAGDMCMYDGLVDNLKNIDIALLPINGRDYFRNANDIIGNFDCVEAVTLAKLIKADLLIPMHHDLYAVNNVRISYFTDAIADIDANRKYKVFTPAECFIYEK